MTVGFVGFNVSGVKKNQAFKFVNLNVLDAEITRCDALLGLPKKIGAIDSETLTVADVAPGGYEYSYELDGRVIIKDNPKIIVGQ